MTLWDYIWETSVVLFFVFLNAFFVAAEFAIVKIRSTQVEPLAQKGNWRAKIAQEIVARLDVYLSATQLGITMTSLALGWVGEPFAAAMLAPLFELMSITSPHVIEALSFAVGFSVITFLHIVLGELAPKSIAIQKTKATTLVVAYPLYVFYRVFRPVIAALNGLANGVLRAIGIHPAGEQELMHSEEELRLLLTQDTSVSVASRNIVLNAMDFRRKQARHVLVPRREVVALAWEAPVRESVEQMRANKYSRYPVYKDTIDNIIGIVHTKDIFKHERHLRPDFSLASVLRDAIFLPETVTLEQVLETMLQKKAHMIVLADEYGGTAGIITLENVLEELVGTIQDEFDRETPDIVTHGPDEFTVDGALTTNDVERLTQTELSPKDILSIGGFVIEQLGHIPQPGETLSMNNILFTVEKVENNAVERLRVRKLPPPPPAEPAPEEPVPAKKKRTRKKKEPGASSGQEETI